MITEEQVANDLLWGLWRCVDDDYKERYKKNVWEHFENAIKSASYTGSLKVFLGNFQKRIPVDLRAEFTKEIIAIIDSGQDEIILNWLRSENTYLVMLVRMRNQDRKEAAAEKWNAKLEQQKINEQADNYPGRPIMYPKQTV
jgi:hypothetical protein